MSEASDSKISGHSVSSLWSAIRRKKLYLFVFVGLLLISGGVVVYAFTALNATANITVTEPLVVSNPQLFVEGPFGFFPCILTGSEPVSFSCSASIPAGAFIHIDFYLSTVSPIIPVSISISDTVSFPATSATTTITGDTTDVIISTGSFSTIVSTTATSTAGQLIDIPFHISPSMAPGTITITVTLSR